MTDEVRLTKADLKRPKPAAPFTMRGLWRLVVWGSTAATALLVAVLSSRGVVGSQRAAVAMTTLGAGTVAVVQPAPTHPTAPLHPFDAQAETKKLADAVHDLSADNDDLKSRLAAVEHSVDDVTGSIARQAKATAPPPWPDSGPPVPATPAAIAAVVAPALPLPMEYGVDIGSAVSIQALRALGRHPLGASAIVRRPGADDFAQRTAAVQSPRIAVGDRAAAQRRRRGKTLHHARALPADLSADDLCRPAFDAGLRAPPIAGRRMDSLAAGSFRPL